MIPQIQPLRPLQPLNPYGYIKRPKVSYTHSQDSYIADRNNPYSVDSVADVLFNVEGIRRVANSVEGYDSRDWGLLAPISDRVVAAVASLNQYYIKPLVSQDLNSFQKSMIIVSNSLNNMSETIDTVTGSNLIKGAIVESGQQDLTNKIGGLVAGTVTLSMLALSAGMTGGLTLGLGFKALLAGQVAYGTSSLLTAVSLDPEGAARGVIKASGLSPMGRTQYDMEYKNWFNRIYAEMALDPVNWLSFSGTVVNSFSKDLGFNISNSTLALGAKFAELDKTLMRFAYNTDPLIGALRGSVKLVKHAKNLRTKQLIRLAEQFVADPKSLNEVQINKVYNYMKKPFDAVNDVRKRYRRTEYLEHIRGSDRDINQGVIQLYGELGEIYDTVDTAQKIIYQDRQDFVRSRLKTMLNDITSGAFLGFRDVADVSDEQIALAISRYFTGQGLDARKYFDFVKLFGLDYKKIRDVGLYDLDPYKKPINEYVESLIEDSETFTYVTNAFYEDLNAINKLVGDNLGKIHKSENMFADGTKALRQAFFERYPFLQKYLVSNKKAGVEEVITQFNFSTFKKFNEGTGVYDVMEGMARKYGVTLEEVFESLDQYVPPSSFDDAIKGLDFVAYSRNGKSREAAAVMKRILPDVSIADALEMEVSQRSNLSRRLNLFLEDLNKAGTRYGSVTLTPMFHEISSQVYSALFEGSDDVIRWSERFTKKHPQMAQLLTQLGDIEEVLVDVDGGKLQKMGGERLVKFIEKLHDYVPSLDTFDDANIKAVIAGFAKMAGVYNTHTLEITGKAPFAFGEGALKDFTSSMRAANSASPETMTKLLDGLHMFVKDNPDNEEAKFLLDLFKNYPEYKPAFGAEEKAALNVMASNESAMILKLSTFMESIVNLHAIQQNGTAMEFIAMLTDDKTSIGRLLKIVQQNMGEHPEFFEIFERTTKVMRAAQGVQNFSNFLSIVHALPSTKVFYNLDTKILSTMKMPAGVEVLPGGTLIIDPNGTAGHDFAIDLATVDFLHAHFEPFELNEVKSQYLMDVNSSFDYAHNKNLRTKGPTLEPITEATIKPTTMYYDLLNKRKARMEAKFDGFFPKNEDGSYDLANVILTPEQATELSKLFSEISADPELKEFFEGLSYFQEVLEEVKKNAWELRKEFASELHNLTRSITVAKQQTIAYELLKKDHAPFIRSGLYSFDSVKALQTVKTNIIEETKVIPRGVDYFQPSQITGEYSFSGRLSTPKGTYDSFYGDRFYFSKSTKMLESKNGKGRPTYVNRAEPLVNYNVIKHVYKGDSFNALDVRASSAEEFAVHSIARDNVATRLEFLHPRLKQHLRYMGITEKNIDKVIKSLEAYRKDSRKYPLNNEAQHYLVGVYHYLKEELTVNGPVDIGGLLGDPRAKYAVATQIATLENALKEAQKRIIDPTLPLDEKNKQGVQKSRDIAKAQKELKPLKEKYAYDLKIAPWLKRYEDIGDALKEEKDDLKVIDLLAERSSLRSKLGYGEGWDNRAQAGSFFQNYVYIEFEARKEAEFAIRRYYTGNLQVRRALFADLNSVRLSADKRLATVASHLMALYPQHKIYLGNDLAESFPMDEIEFDNARVVDDNTIKYFLEISERDMHTLKNVTMVITNPMKHWNINPESGGYFAPEQKIMQQIHTIINKRIAAGKPNPRFKIIGPDGRIFNHDGSMYPDFDYPQTNPTVYDRSRPSIKEKVRQNNSAYASFNSVVKYAHRAAWSNDPMQDGDMLRHYVTPKKQNLEVKNNPIPHLMRASDVNSSERLNLSSGFTGAYDLFTKARLVPEYIDANELELPMFEPSDDVTFEVEDSLFSRAMPAYWASLLKPIQDASLIKALSELDQADDLEGLHAFHAAHLSSRFASVADDVKIKKMRGVLRQLFNETGVPNQFSSVDFLKTPVVSLDSKLGEFWSAATPEGANNLGILITQLFRELNEQPHGLPVVFRNSYFKPDRDIVIDVAGKTKYSYVRGERDVFMQTKLNEDEKQLSNIVNYADKEVDRLVYLINVTEKDMALFNPNIADNVILPKALNGYKKFAYPSREAFSEERLEDHIGRYGLVKNTSTDGVYYTMAPYRVVSRKISGLKLAQKQHEFGLIPSFDKYLQEKGMLSLSGELLIDTPTYLLEEEAYLKQYPKVNPINKVWEVLHKETGYTPEDIFLIKVRPNRKKFTEHTLIMISDYSKIYELRRGGFKVFTREQLDALNTAVDEGKDAHALFKAHIPNAKVMEAIEAGVTIEQVPEVNKLERARQVYWKASTKVRAYITGHLREKAKAHILIKGSTLIEGTDKTYFEALAEKLSEYSAKRLHGDYTNRDSTIDFKEITDITQIVDDVRKLLVESYGSPFDASELQQIEDLEWLVNSLIVDGVNNNFVDNYAARMAEDAVGAMTPEMKEIMKLVSENEGETIKSELQSFVVDLAKQVNTLKIELTKYEAIRPRPFGEDTVIYYDSEGSVNRARARVRAVLDDLLSLVNTKAALSKVGETIFSEMQMVAIREFRDAKQAFFGMYTAIEQNAFLDGPVHSEDASGLFEVLNAGAFKEGDSKKVSLAKKIREFNAPHKVAERLEDREVAYQAKLANTKLSDNALDRYDISTYSPLGKEGIQLKEKDITLPKYTQVGDGIPDFTRDGKAQPFDIIKDMHEYAHDQKKGLTEFLKKYSFLQEHYDHLTKAGLDESAKLQYLLTQAAKFTDAALESDFDKVVAGHHIYSEPIPGFPIEFKWNEATDVTPLVKTTDTSAFNPKTLTVVSGGQTGADIGGLLSARRYGFVTGGKAPKGFWSEKDGTVTPKLLKELGLEEDASGLSGGDALIERSKANVNSADGTIAFLPQGKSVGTSKTIGYAQTGVWRHRIENYDGDPHKPNLVIKWTDSVESATAAIVNFLKDNNIKTLNIAGSRESVVKAFDPNASMQKRTEEIMDNVFAQFHAEFGMSKPQEVVKPIENSNVLNVNKIGPSVFDTPGAQSIDDVVAIMKKAPRINKTKKGVKQKEFEQLSFADIMEEEKE